MAMRRKSPQHSARLPPSLSPHHTPLRIRFTASQRNASVIDLKQTFTTRKKLSQITSTHNIYVPQQKMKSQTINILKSKEGFFPCKRHVNQAIRYVNVMQGQFDGFCELCIVRSDLLGKNVKLEHLADLYHQKREALAKASQDLLELEDKIAKLYKEIVKANLVAAPILQQLEDMEKKIVKEIEKSFNKIKAKFVKYNPFKELREPLKAKIEETTETLQQLDGGTAESFGVLEKLYNYENKIVYEVAGFIEEINMKIAMNKFSNPLLDSDFTTLCQRYSKFYDKIIRICSNFSDNFIIKV